MGTNRNNSWQKLLTAGHTLKMLTTFSCHSQTEIVDHCAQTEWCQISYRFNGIFTTTWWCLQPKVVNVGDRQSSIDERRRIEAQPCVAAYDIAWRQRRGYLAGCMDCEVRREFVRRGDCRSFHWDEERDGDGETERNQSGEGSAVISRGAGQRRRGRKEQASSRSVLNNRGRPIRFDEREIQIFNVTAADDG
jgi:hypothetical protein